MQPDSNRGLEDPFIAPVTGSSIRGTSQFPVVPLLPIVYTKGIESASLLASRTPILPRPIVLLSTLSSVSQ